MLKKLFKPKWQHGNPAVRKEALLRLDSNKPDQHDILAHLAEHDCDPTVRLAAVEKLVDLSLLKKLCLDSSDKLRKTASDRYADLLGGIEGNLPISLRQQELTDCSQQMLYEIARRNADKAMQEQALTLLTEQELLLQLAINSSDSQVRQLAVAGLTEEHSIKSAIQSLQNRDKRATQLARGKLNQIKTQQRDQQESTEQLQQVCGHLEALADSEYHRHFSNKYQLLQQQWEKLHSTQPLSTDNPFQQRFARASQQCLAVIDRHQEDEKLRLAEENQRHQIQQSLQQSQEQICDEMEKILARLQQDGAADPANPNDLGSSLRTLKQGWQTHLDEQRPHPREQMRFDKAVILLDDYLAAANRLTKQQEKIAALCHEVENNTGNPGFSTLNSSLKKLGNILSNLQWPDPIPADKRIAALQTLQTQLQQQLDHLQAQQQQIQQTVKQQLEEMSGKLDGGAMKNAQQLAAKIKTNLAKLNQHDRASYERQFGLLNKRLSDFDDWRQFATTPKREQLCCDMEKLIDIAIPALQKSEAIRELQQEWKALGDSRHTQQLWQRFKKAADTAYEPCKAYFDQQHALRNHNFQQRQQICNELAIFLAQTNWQQADWHAIEIIYTTAKQEWRSFSPVDRNKGKEIQAAFNKLLDQLSDKLREERQRNAAAKVALIEQAQQLFEGNDINDAIELVKQLQNQWKKIGITFRKENQKLWHQFRQVCDGVFERRNHEREVAEHEREDNHRHAIEICQRIRELSALSDEQLSDSMSQFNTFKNEYQQLGPVPKQHYQDVKQQFQQSCDLFQKQYFSIAKRQQQRSTQTLKQLAELCEQLENLPNTAGEANADKKQSIESGWQKPADFPDDWWQAIDQRFQKALQNGLMTDPSDQEEALRQLCIRAEIMADLSTPDEDQQRRMQYQMQRLSGGLGQDTSNRDGKDALALQLKWLSTPSIPADRYQPLKQRFFSAMDCIRGE